MPRNLASCLIFARRKEDGASLLLITRALRSFHIPKRWELRRVREARSFRLVMQAHQVKIDLRRPYVEVDVLYPKPSLVYAPEPRAVSTMNKKVAQLIPTPSCKKGKIHNWSSLSSLDGKSSKVYFGCLAMQVLWGRGRRRGGRAQIFHTIYLVGLDVTPNICALHAD
jgi:hypothetical protein